MSRTTLHTQKGKFNEFVKGIPCPLEFNMNIWTWEEIRDWSGPFGKFMQYADRYNNDVGEFKQKRIQTKLKDLDRDFKQQLHEYYEEKNILRGGAV